MNTCRNCRHWTANESSYPTLDRNTTKYTFECPKLKNLLSVEINQGHGYDAGGATTEAIETPGEFGCNMHEKL
jgi:hypothetical protein